MPIAVRAVPTELPPYVDPERYVRDVMGRWIGGDRRTDTSLDHLNAASTSDRRRRGRPYPERFTMGGLE